MGGVSSWFGYNNTVQQLDPPYNNKQNNTISGVDNVFTSAVDVEQPAVEYVQEYVTPRSINWRRELRKKDEQLSLLRHELESVKKEKEKLLTRLSAIAGTKLTDNNPNITDLSDENRPTKLAEKYCELYDNEWTEAFAFLTELSEKTEEEAIRILLESFVESYNICKTYNEIHLDEIKKMVTHLQGTDEVVKLLKDERKRHYRVHLKTFKESTKKEFLGIKGQAQLKEGINKNDAKQFENFLIKCRELCFLMTIQDPCIAVDCELDKSGQQFDNTVFRDYTVKGMKIKYLVWPSIYLTINGPLLVKGIAQCYKRRPKSSRDSTTDLTKSVDSNTLEIVRIKSNETADTQNAEYEMKTVKYQERDDQTCSFEDCGWKGTKSALNNEPGTENIKTDASFNLPGGICGNTPRQPINENITDKDSVAETNGENVATFVNNDNDEKYVKEDTTELQGASPMIVTYL